MNPTTQSYRWEEEVVRCSDSDQVWTNPTKTLAESNVSRRTKTNPSKGRKPHKKLAEIKPPVGPLKLIGKL